MKRDRSFWYLLHLRCCCTIWNLLLVAAVMLSSACSFSTTSAFLHHIIADSSSHCCHAHKKAFWFHTYRNILIMKSSSEEKGELLRRSDSEQSQQQAQSQQPQPQQRQQQPPRWCPEQQIFIGGVPGATEEEVDELLRENGGSLRVFGYGSLCWKAGGGILSKPDVTKTLGHARGYRRSWAQRSTDHRGTAEFPGVVCTLLKASEVQTMTAGNVEGLDNNNIMTEGAIYTVPSHLSKDCLAELDFREKGGYAREIIEVVEDETEQTVKTLLYRGTPDNPAIWPRLLVDLPLAAAVIAVSVGPSGPNDVYLNQLNAFLESTPSSTADFVRHDDTTTLASMTKALQQYPLYFLYGCGSNQHEQILRNDPSKDEPQLEIGVLVTTSTSETTTDPIDPPKQIFAGGGHSGLLTKSGSLFLWGWNDHGQCGKTTTTTTTSASTDSDNNQLPFPVRHPLKDIQVEKAVLGFAHTLLIERGTKRLYGFGDNSRGQVNGSVTNTSSDVINIDEPTVPSFAQSRNEKFIDIAAGVFHSAAITDTGELVTFGCSRKGQSLGQTNGRANEYDGDDENENDNEDGAIVGRWKPEDGCRLLQVVCGRQHTAVLDDRGRVWTFGDNKYGQLGRPVKNDGCQPKDTKSSNFDPIPALVDGMLGKDHCDNGSKCIAISSGWSHLVAQVWDSSTQETSFYGWGRSDKGQLACKDKAVTFPREMDHQILKKTIDMSVSCGSESTYFWNARAKTAYGCGWNEHGNLGVGNGTDEAAAAEDTKDITELANIKTIVSPPTYSQDRWLLLAGGGAHLLAALT